MIANPAVVPAQRAVNTILSGWRMCQVTREADHAGRNPASTYCCDITARRRASAIRAGCRLYSSTTQAYLACDAAQTNVAFQRQARVVAAKRHCDHAQFTAGPY